MDRVRTIIQAEAAFKKNLFGKGVRVAVLDSGIWPHPDFTSPKNRILLFQDFIHGRTIPYDDFGHGTHVAGIIGGNGLLSKGKYRGIAPECEFIICKILDKNGNGNGEDLLAALRFVRAERKRYGIKIINLSFCGVREYGKEKQEDLEVQKKIEEELEGARKEGMICIVAAGNNGPTYDSIYFPGNSENVITVGTSDDELPVYINGKKWVDYSARGKKDGLKPDLTAPGYRIVSCGKSNEIYCVKTGTSMSAPLVAGACSLLVEKYPHIGLEEAKLYLQLSAKDVGKEYVCQGAGMLQIKTMLHLACTAV